jgi:hypothetical protein
MQSQNSLIIVKSLIQEREQILQEFERQWHTGTLSEADYAAFRHSLRGAIGELENILQTLEKAEVVG